MCNFKFKNVFFLTIEIKNAHHFPSLYSLFKNKDWKIHFWLFAFVSKTIYTDILVFLVLFFVT